VRLFLDAGVARRRGLRARRCAAERVRPGDVVIVSGPIGDHGVAIMLARGGLALDADVERDTAPLWPVVDALLGGCRDGMRWMRDASRGCGSGRPALRRQRRSLRGDRRREHADATLDALRAVEVSTEAAVVGAVGDDPPGRVLGRTAFGGHRMIHMLVGDPLPRICRGSPVGR
jgi:hydrogenase expression/formation protein HypE